LTKPGKVANLGQVTSESEVAAAIRSALRIVEESDVPDDLRAVAFQRAYESLTVSALDSASRPAHVTNAREIELNAPSGASSAASVAAKLRLEAELVERVLDFDEDGVHLIVPRSYLAKAKSTAIQQVAMVLVAARQAAGLEEWTPQSVIREETEVLGVEDRSNFAAHIKNLVGVRTRGSGRTGELKMNAVGYETAADFIRQLGKGRQL
jgi:hypothetical protein